MTLQAILDAAKLAESGNHEAFNRMMAEMEGLQTEGWYCPKCDREVASAFVAFDEKHDIHSEGCGSQVEGMPVPDYASSLDAIAPLLQAKKDWNWELTYDGLTGLHGFSLWKPDGSVMRTYNHESKSPSLAIAVVLLLAAGLTTNPKETRHE
jgi:hypothetical protein